MGAVMCLTAWQLIRHITWVITGGERRELVREMQALLERTNEILTRLDAEEQRAALAPCDRHPACLPISPYPHQHDRRRRRGRS